VAPIGHKLVVVEKKRLKTDDSKRANTLKRDGDSEMVKETGTTA